MAVTKTSTIQHRGKTAGHADIESAGTSPAPRSTKTKNKGICSPLNWALFITLILLLGAEFCLESDMGSKDGTATSSASTVESSTTESANVDVAPQNPTTHDIATISEKDLEAAIAGKNNVAKGKYAVQSSDDWGGLADRAVDGNRDQHWEGNSITATKDECSPWWQVDLGSVHHIESVAIFNRLDCCTERLRRFDVDVLKLGDAEIWETVHTLHHKDIASSITYGKFPEGTQGSVVRVKFGHCTPLSLAEVEVYGSPV